MSDAVPLRKLNQETSAVIARVVDSREEVTITRAGEPIAKLVPIAKSESLLARWVTEGKAVAPSATGLPGGASEPGTDDVAQALASDRDDERW